MAKAVSAVVRRARADPVCLWTSQSPKVLEQLLETGKFRADGRRIYHWDFRRPYQWMKAQMKMRLVVYHGGFPIWAFRRYPLKAWISKGEYVFKIKISQSRFLLSDFSSWHTVPNDFECILHQVDRRRSKEETWENIFDLEGLDRSAYWGPVRDIQAVFEELFLNDVVEVRTRDGEVVYSRA